MGYTHVDLFNTYRGSPGGGGGRGTQTSDGAVPLKPPNPYPSLRVSVAEKGLLGVFTQENYLFVYFSGKMDKNGTKISINSKITKLHPMFREFSQNHTPCL